MTTGVAVIVVAVADVVAVAAIFDSPRNFDDSCCCWWWCCWWW